MMPRAARVVFEGVVHHITQRGNYRQNIFEDSADRKKYIEFVSEYSRKYQMKIYAYCLMTNHVHFLAAPLRRDSLAMTFKYSNMRYSSYFNTKNRILRDRLRYLHLRNIVLHSIGTGLPSTVLRRQERKAGSWVSQDRDPVHRPLKGDPKQEP